MGRIPSQLAILSWRVAVSPAIDDGSRGVASLTIGSFPKHFGHTAKRIRT